MDDFLPASATDAKSRKASLKQTKSVLSSTKSKKGKSKSTLLSTQPRPSAAGPTPTLGDDDDMDFERLPLYDASLLPRPTTTSSSSALDAASAMMDTSTSDDEDDSILIDPSSLSLPSPVTRIPISQIPGSNALSFPAVSHTSTSGLTQRRKVGIPQHRMTPLKRDWVSIYGPLVEECGLQVRMNLGKRWVELKVSLNLLHLMVKNLD
jgi:RNA-binding protein PNO1